MAGGRAHRALVFLGITDDDQHPLAGLSARDRQNVTLALRKGRVVEDPRLAPFLAQQAARLSRFYNAERWSGLVLAIFGVIELAIAHTLASQVVLGLFWILLGASVSIGFTRAGRRVKAAQLANPLP